MGASPASTSRPATGASRSSGTLKVADGREGPVARRSRAYQFIGNVAWSKLNSKTLTAAESVELADRGIGALQKAAELQPEEPEACRAPGLDLQLPRTCAGRLVGGRTRSRKCARSPARLARSNRRGEEGPRLSDAARTRTAQAAPQPPTARRSGPRPAADSPSRRRSCHGDDYAVSRPRHPPLRARDVRELRRGEESQAAAVGRRRCSPARSSFHIGLFVAMWIKTIWEIEQLERPKTTIDLAVAPPPPPPPPPPPKGGAKPHDVQITPKKIKVKDIVQPVKIEKQEVTAGRGQGRPERRRGWRRGWRRRRCRRW